MLALGAYTKKADADALVYNAMGEHAKQVEVTSFVSKRCKTNKIMLEQM